MSSEPRDNPDEVLERAIAARRDMAIPDGPPPAVLAETLKRMQAAGDTSSFSLKRRLFTMKTISRLAVAAVLMVAIGGLFFAVVSGPGVAFADVLRGVREAQSVRFKGSGTLEIPGRPPQPISMETTITDSGRMRQVNQPGGMVTIVDWREGKWLTLDPINKQATVMEMSNVPAEMRQGNLLEEFRKLDEKAATPLEDKEIAGRPARGFQVAAAGMEMKVWADKQTHLPVLVEQTLRMPSMPATTLTLTDFVWNAPVDEAQLSLRPPEGYQVQNLKFDAGPASEKDLLTALKAAAELNDGAFPAGIDVAGISEAVGRQAALRLMENPLNARALQARAAEAMTVIARGWMFMNDPKNGTDWHYAGKDIPLGKAGTPILWYRPAGAAGYRVIDADLSVREVAAGKLPDVPSTRLGPPATMPRGDVGR